MSSTALKTIDQSTNHNTHIGEYVLGLSQLWARIYSNFHANCFDVHFIERAVFSHLLHFLFHLLTSLTLFKFCGLNNFLFSRKPARPQDYKRRRWTWIKWILFPSFFVLFLHAAWIKNLFIFFTRLVCFPGFVWWLGHVRRATARGSGACNSRTSGVSDCGIQRVKYGEKWLSDSFAVIYVHDDWTFHYIKNLNF